VANTTWTVTRPQDLVDAADRLGATATVVAALVVRYRNERLLWWAWLAEQAQRRQAEYIPHTDLPPPAVATRGRLDPLMSVAHGTIASNEQPTEHSAMKALPVLCTIGTLALATVAGCQTLFVTADGDPSTAPPSTFSEPPAPTPTAEPTVATATVDSRHRR
jgi:hypothetical protein